MISWSHVVKLLSTLGTSSVEYVTQRKLSHLLNLFSMFAFRDFTF